VEGRVVLGLLKTTVVCVSLAVVGSVEKMGVEEATVEELSLVVVLSVVDWTWLSRAAGVFKLWKR
jgi:hypothetical protein